MSSREIAELTGKTHFNVLRDIDNMLKLLELKIEAGFYTDANGEPRRCFNLPKRETLILVSGYSIAMRAAIIDRWQELESKVASAPVNFRDPALLLGVLTDLQNQVAEQGKVIAVQSAEIVEAKPKVEFFDGYVSADGLYGLAEGARVLSDNPNKFLRQPREDHYLFYNSRGEQVPYARHRRFFDVRVVKYPDPKTGEEKASSKTFFKPLAMTYFAEKYPRTQAAA